MAYNEFKTVYKDGSEVIELYYDDDIIAEIPFDLPHCTEDYDDIYIEYDEYGCVLSKEIVRDLIERYDLVDFTGNCNKCGEPLSNWRTRYGDGERDRLPVVLAHRFSTTCPKCHTLNKRQVVVDSFHLENDWRDV